MADQAVEQTFDVELTGCRPEPLASYLKALGVLRLVAEQKDKNAGGFWRGEVFVVRSALDSAALARFFIAEWRPTSVVSPWNSGSGFWPTTSDEALREIETSTEPRLSDYAETIRLARNAIKVLGLMEAPDKGESKTRLLTFLRANVSENALCWLDATAVLTDDEPIYPALLGTGGNDGRQDFSNNFMQRVLTVLADSRSLESSLFGKAVRAGIKGSMGQFSPSALDRSNAWDFVFAIEGSMMMAGAATRRLESRDGNTLAFPFHARAATAPSLADGEEGRGEIWLPRWTTPSSFTDVRRLFAEGRAKTNTGTAATGLDFARSIASLGTDRGLSEFVRFSLQARNGKNYFATPIGRYPTNRVRSARLLDDLDSWFVYFRRRASGAAVPGRVGVARRRLETAMLEAASTGAVGPVLLELGAVERSLAQSLSFTAGAFLRPLPRLPSGWALDVEDSSVEQRLAAALATRPGIRGRLLPLDRSGASFGRGDDPGYVFTERPLVENLHALLLREDVEGQQQVRGSAEEGRRPRCSLTDIAQFIDGQVDDVMLERWVRGLVLVEGGIVPTVPTDTRLPPALFAVLALVHHRHVGNAEIPRTTGVLARACAGDSVGASAPAIRRLNASGRPLPVPTIVEPSGRTRRIAAALAFPLTTRQRRTLESMVLPAIDDVATTGPLQEQA
jgi:CRISPR-associated protein Csx17